jgi:hypothetical protein
VVKCSIWEDLSISKMDRPTVAIDLPDIDAIDNFHSVSVQLVTIELLQFLMVREEPTLSVDDSHLKRYSSFCIIFLLLLHFA